jgi:hypothetical protein
MKHTVKTASDDMLNIPSFMTIGWGIEVILRILPKKCEAVVLVLLIRVIYDIRHDISSFMTVGSGIQGLRFLPQQFERLQC